MQNHNLIKSWINELEEHGHQVTIIQGDRYCPVHALEIKDFNPPKCIIERKVDLLIPMARCSGYLPDAKLAGIHVNKGLHGTLEKSETLVPFCDPVQDTSWMDSTYKFYPYYETTKESLIGGYYLCLNEPNNPPISPLHLLEVTIDYLTNWSEYALSLACQHGAIARGIIPGDMINSQEWIEHLVENVSPKVKEILLEASRS